MAGGLGKRIRNVCSDLPKPIIPILGKPILLYQIENLKKSGITEIVLITGYLHEKIISFFKDGSAFGVHITYFVEEEPLGTAGGLYYIKKVLQEPFLLINGDLIFDIDFTRFIKNFKGDGMLFVHPNTHPYDSYHCDVDQNGKLVGWRMKGECRNLVNAGIHLFTPKIFDYLDGSPKDLDREIIPNLMADGSIYTYRSSEYVKDPGIPQRYQEVKKELAAGLVSTKNLKRKQRAIFLDRDGVINCLNGFITKPEQLCLLDGVVEAIKKINQSGFLAIGITNQPVIARGECSIEDLDQIHAHMDCLLGTEGGYLDDLFFCPHHPDKGFQGERVEYKIPCNCRKPNCGLLLQAAERYHIDLHKSWMVGDSETDVKAGCAAGCKTVSIGNSNWGSDLSATSLLEAVNQILSL